MSCDKYEPRAGDLLLYGRGSDSWWLMMITNVKTYTVDYVLARSDGLIVRESATHSHLRTYIHIGTYEIISRFDRGRFA